MRRTRTTTMLATTALAALLTVSTASATPPVGVTNQPFLPGKVVDRIDINERLSDGTKIRVKSKGATYVNVDNLTIAPGGATGWHSHPTLSFTVVTSGQLTEYTASRRRCSTRVLKAGDATVEGFVTHDLRNEGPLPATIVVTQLVPEGVNRRVDEPVPASCRAA